MVHDKVRPSDLKKSISFTFNINNFLFLNDRYLFFFVNETRDLQNSTHHKKQNKNIVNPPLRHPQKHHDFDGFSHFLEKTRDIFLHYFWYILERDLNNFFKQQTDFACASVIISRTF